LSKVICILFVFCGATAIASPAQVFTIIHNFVGFPSDGQWPYAGLLQASDGNFYGTTSGGGAYGGYEYGTVFKITPSGTLTVLHSFNSADGDNPLAGLVQGSDGNFYGTTYYGGANEHGTVFKITPDGTPTTLYSFCSQSRCSDGSQPHAGLVQGRDGNFYGTTEGGGILNNECGGCGTVFQITPSGALTTLYSFCSQSNCTDGYILLAGLVQGTDGNFYGTTTYGGANGDWGTVFKITLSGTLTTLHSFSGSDGVWPFAGLVQAGDGNFYGTTLGGGANGQGTVFKITPGGTVATLYSFCSQNNCSDGANPQAGLVQATDGNFYGTTYAGGPSDYGTVFKITPNGTLVTLHSFGGGDGARPSGAVIQATDGNFYGTTSGGGANNDGTVFRLLNVRPCIVCASAE
jgi:uncharacterized repeat protein (TIGR03803 family)